jgi:GTP-binding protein HflX
LDFALSDQDENPQILGYRYSGTVTLLEIKQDQRERAVLVGVIGSGNSREQVDEYINELQLLADTAGADVIHKVFQERSRIDAAHFIGKGKAEYIAEIVETDAIKIVIFDDDLSPTQVRNLERLIKCKIVDRTGLILDIFALRAKTTEAKTQVELAQLQYLLPRLTRQWTHLSQQYGGIGTKGPGEKQIETDRRLIKHHIGTLKERLERINRQRRTQRKGRSQIDRVALVGYTNAGKSTLLNLLADADVFVEDRLFATLDATVRQVSLTPTKKILLSDTVGFIRKLPPHLIASFKSTLEEVVESDILLHVVDISHPNFDEQIHVVNETLRELQAANKPTVMVFNKIDMLKDKEIISYLSGKYPHSVFVSATRGINITGLKSEIEALLSVDVIEKTLTLGFDEYKLISYLHDTAEVLETKYDDESLTIRLRVNRKDADKVEKIIEMKRKHSAPKR